MSERDWETLAQLLKAITHAGKPWQEKKAELQERMRQEDADGDLEEIVGWFQGDDGVAVA